MDNQESNYPIYFDVYGFGITTYYAFDRYTFDFITKNYDVYKQIQNAQRFIFSMKIKNHDIRFILVSYLIEIKQIHLDTYYNPPIHILYAFDKCVIENDQKLLSVFLDSCNIPSCRIHKMIMMINNNTKYSDVLDVLLSHYNNYCGHNIDNDN